MRAKSYRNAVSVVAACTVLAGSLSAQELEISGVEQLLGTPDVVSRGAVQVMRVSDTRPPDYDLLFDDPDALSSYVSCARIAGDGVYCLDRGNKLLKKFAGTPAAFVADPLSCLDIPSLNPRGEDTCTAYTFGLFENGAVHAIAGKDRGKAYSVAAVVEQFGGACPGGTTSIGNALGTTYCSAEIYTGRPVVSNLKPVTGNLADKFPLGAGFIGVEQRGDFVHYAVDPIIASPTTILGKKELGLKGQQAVEDGDLLQIANPDDDSDPYIYAIIAVNDGRILAYLVGETDPVITAFDLSTVQSGTPANTAEPAYGLKVDESSGITLVTDRNYQQLVALSPVVDEDGRLLSLAVTQEPTGETTSTDLILSTAPYDPLSVSTTPGKFINFNAEGCGIFCTLITGANGAAAFNLLDFNIVDRGNGVNPEGVLYHIRNAPDPTLRPLTAVDILDNDPDWPGLGIANCIDPSTRAQAVDCLLEPSVNVLRRVAGSTGGYSPEQFDFNYTPLLNGLFPEAASLPPMWVGGVRGRLANDALFGMLFFVSDADEADTLIAETDAGVLGSFESPCELATDLQADGFDIDDPGSGGLLRLLNWDVVHRTSERFLAYTGDFTGTFVNVGCINPTRSAIGGISGIIYDAEIEYCPDTVDDSGTVVIDGMCSGGEQSTTPVDWAVEAASEIPDDAAIAKAFARKFVGLRLHLDELLCNASTGTLLSAGDCATLRASWDNAQDKASKSLFAAIQQSTASAGTQNFVSTISQLQNYQNNLLAATPVDPDPANYVGEHEAWVATLLHLLNDKLAFAVPDAGWVETDTEWAKLQFMSP